MITVHHLENSRSQRVLWLLEELAVPYELVKYARDAKTQLAPPELLKIHPLGKSPVITDDRDGGVTIAESGAILEYVAETYGQGRLVPTPGTAASRRYRYYMHYAEGSLMPLLLLKLIVRRIETAKMPFFARPIARKIASSLAGGFVDPNLARHVAFLAAELADRPWFAGDDMTCADIQMSYPLEAIAARVPGAPAAIGALVDRIRARPAFQRAIERGGTYEMMG